MFAEGNALVPTLPDVYTICESSCRATDSVLQKEISESTKHRMEAHNDYF